MQKRLRRQPFALFLRARGVFVCGYRNNHSKGRTNMIPRSVYLVAVIFGAASCLAQDTRNVIEPFFPQLCTTLDARLQSHGHTLAPEDEQKLDTARIQKAIDKCGKGRGVLLHVNETNDAFLSGPLELRPDV